MTTSLETFTCYDAIARDDPQFDGRFFTAVLTTGIFCRPICRAQTPRPENVRFFSTAAAAAESGFRPCLRCKPESAPDPTQWQTTSPVVSRALRLISQGVLDEAGVGELARRLHVSSRQLRRLFLDELGTPPVAVAQTRRLLFAKKLIDETNLTMAEVAFSAGYGSVRRFNDAIRQTYGRTPTKLRKSRRRSINDPAGTTVELKLYYRDPYNWPAMLGYLRAHAIPGVELVSDDLYRRTIQLDEIPGWLEVRPLKEERAVLVRVPASLAQHLLPITEHVKDLFDLRADPNLIDACLASDSFLAPAVHRRRGTRLPGVWDGYELAIRAILNPYSSDDVNERVIALVERFGDPWPDAAEADLSHMFPTPERLSMADLTPLELPARQVDEIRSLSRAIVDGSLDFNGSVCLTELVGQLSGLYGLAESAATEIAMRALREPDAALPCATWFGGGQAYLGGRPVTDSEINRRSDRWRPWRSYAAMYLWSAAASEASRPLHSAHALAAT